MATSDPGFSRPPVPLGQATLSALPETVGGPRYDRGALTPGIVHFGLGNFHRAHQQYYLNRLMNQGGASDWGVVGAGVMEGDRAMRAALAAQDNLWTLVEQSAERATAQVSGCMTGFLPVGEAPAIIDALTDPAIRIVSLTVTEGGYFINAATGSFDATHPAIAADGADPATPKTVFGLILAGLRARRDKGLAPFTVMSCDNLPHNGRVTRETVVGLARLSDPAFADWVEATVAFPNGMVDRITPATGAREKDALARDFGVDDAAPVFCEDFVQWVLEDKFPAGRPALEQVGVEFVSDVSPYELMKIRILNGGHAVIAYPAGLLDIHFVHEAMAHPLIVAFLEKVEREEILPGVPPVPKTDLEAYFSIIRTRFANPHIGDTVRRLCLDGSNRQPKFIIPSIADALAQGRSAGGLALESALWCRYCFGESESGAGIAPNDPNWEDLKAVAREAKTDPGAWLAMEHIYGAVGQDPGFRSAFADWLALLWSQGTEATLRRYLGI